MASSPSEQQPVGERLGPWQSKLLGAVLPVAGRGSLLTPAGEHTRLHNMRAPVYTVASDRRGAPVFRSPLSVILSFNVIPLPWILISFNLMCLHGHSRHLLGSCGAVGRADMAFHISRGERFLS